MKKSVNYRNQLSTLKGIIIGEIKNLMNSQDFEIVSVEDLENGDYEQNHLTLRNDFGEVYDVIVVGVKNGNLLTHNENSENYESNVTPLGDIDSTDDLILLLDLLEDKSTTPIESEKIYDFKVGDTVIVADPEPHDLWNHSFMAEITNVEEDLGLCVIVDGDGEFWDVDFDKLKKQDD